MKLLTIAGRKAKAHEKIQILKNQVQSSVDCGIFFNNGVKNIYNFNIQILEVFMHKLGKFNLTYMYDVKLKYILLYIHT